MSPTEALDALFRENELPMSDRNGELHDIIRAAVAEERRNSALEGALTIAAELERKAEERRERLRLAEAPYAYLVVQASGFIVGAWRDRKTAEYVAAKRPAHDKEKVVPVVVVQRKNPCGECHLQPGERCDICGAMQEQKP